MAYNSDITYKCKTLYVYIYMFFNLYWARTKRNDFEQETCIDIHIHTHTDTYVLFWSRFCACLEESLRNETNCLPCAMQDSNAGVSWSHYSADSMPTNKATEWTFKNRSKFWAGQIVPIMNDRWGPKVDFCTQAKRIAPHKRKPKAPLGQWCWVEFHPASSIAMSSDRGIWPSR